MKHTKKKKQKTKIRNKKNLCQNGKIVKYQYRFTGTCGVAQNPWVHSAGTGFVGMGAGWKTCKEVRP